METKKLSGASNLSRLVSAAKNRKAKEILTVSVNDVISKEQVRKEFDELEGLAETLKTEGQQSPIIVSPKVDGKYVIQKGERRWRACHLAGIEEIDIIVNHTPQTKAQEIIGELIENMQRQDLKPLEEAQGIQDALDADPSLNKSKIAKRLGKSNAYVSQHLALLKMPVCVRELYDQNITRDPEILNNLRQLHELDEQRCESVCQIAQESGISRKASRDIFRDAKEMHKNDNKGPGGLGEDSGVDTESSPTTLADDGTDGTPAANEKQPHDSDNPRDAIVSGQESSVQQSKGTMESPAGVNTEKPAPASSSQPKKETDWYEVEPCSARILVNVPTETDVKEGLLVLNRACDNPAEVYVRLTGKGGKLIKVLASEIDLVGMKPE